MKLVTLIFVLCSCHGIHADIGCDLIGECLDANVVGIASRHTPRDCLEYCHGVDGCEYYTHYEYEDTCFAFSSCPLFSESSCTDCVSGDATCKNLECSHIGRCDTGFIDFEYLDDMDECLNFCIAHPTCQWYTLDKANRLCIISQDDECIEQESCPTCVSGQRDCEKNILLVMAGEPYRTSVDIIRLSEDNTEYYCIPIDTLDSDSVLRDGVAFTLQGLPHICGGYSFSEVPEFLASSLCTYYTPGTNVWTSSPATLSADRGVHSALELREDYVLISGGLSTNFTVVYDSFETYSYNRSELLDDVLEVPVYGHCTVKIDSDRFFVAGGNADNAGMGYLYSSNTFAMIDNFELPSDRIEHACGLAYNDKGEPEIVLAGGVTDIYGSDILSLTNSTFRRGPFFPQGMKNGAFVQYKDTFLVMGGINAANDTLTSIFMYDPVVEAWEKRDEEMSAPRYDASAVLVDNSVVYCRALP